MLWNQDSMHSRPPGLRTVLTLVGSPRTAGRVQSGSQGGSRATARPIADVLTVSVVIHNEDGTLSRGWLRVTDLVAIRPVQQQAA